MEIFIVTVAQTNEDGVIQINETKPFNTEAAAQDYMEEVVQDLRRGSGNGEHWTVIRKDDRYTELFGYEYDCTATIHISSIEI